MSKRALPLYVHRKRARGREYLYFDRGGTRIRLYEKPGTAAFAAEYARAIRGDAAEASAPEPQRTFRALIRSYRASERYQRLAPRTKRDYDKVLAFIEDKMGRLEPAKMRRKDVIRARDANRDAVRFANYVVQVIRPLFEHAIDLGWMEENPARGVSLLKPREAKERRAWPTAKLYAFREAAPLGSIERTLFEVLLGTGQRIGDAIAMRWGDIEDGGLWVRQGKTKRRLWLPLSRDLRAALDAAPRAGLTIVADDEGRPLTYWKAQRRMFAIRQRIGAEDYDQHALRHTATAVLAELGLDDDTIMAITGHTTRAMVAHYAGEARQRVRAQRAIAALDAAGDKPKANGRGTRS